METASVFLNEDTTSSARTLLRVRTFPFGGSQLCFVRRDLVRELDTGHTDMPWYIVFKAHLESATAALHTSQAMLGYIIYLATLAGPR
jgi:hypothetical protein